MTKTLIVVAAFLTLSVPAALAVPPEGKGKPDNPGQSAAAPGQSAAKNAAKTCKNMKKNDPNGFKTLYGDKPNAFGKCVSSTVDNAAKQCKKMRKDHPDDFKADYGDKPNAYGKCVSTLAKQKKTTTTS